MGWIYLRGWQLARDWKSHISVKSISSTMGWKYWICIYHIQLVYYIHPQSIPFSTATTAERPRRSRLVQQLLRLRRNPIVLAAEDQGQASKTRDRNKRTLAPRREKRWETKFRKKGNNMKELRKMMEWKSDWIIITIGKINLRKSWENPRKAVGKLVKKWWKLDI